MLDRGELLIQADQAAGRVRLLAKHVRQAMQEARRERED
jgi:hypothetical protein